MFPETPDGNVAEVEGAPPGIEHFALQVEDAVARYAWRWRNQRGEAIVDLFAIFAVGARQQVPQGESIARASFSENYSKG